MPHDVFLSYASTDRAAADAVCAALEARGIRCWIAPRDVPAGADWGEAILTAIGRAHAMVLVLSRGTAASVHVRNEVVTAVSQSLALVPVRVEDCQPSGALRLHLAGSHWVNVYPAPVEQHADVLAAGVRLALAADATIEIPRAQAAAMVAAARASHASAASFTSAEHRRGPVAPSLSAPGQASRTAPAPPPAQAVPTAGPAAPRRQAGLAIALALGAVALLAAVGVAAWFLEPRLRAMLGAAPAGPVLVADTGRLPAAGDAPGAPAGSASSSSPAATARSDDANGPRPPAPSPSLAGLGGAITPPPATAPPPVPAAARFAQAPSPAGPATRVMNAATDTISRLFVAGMADGVGSEDWLGNAQIMPGNAVLIRAPAGQGCVFNIRAVYVGGRTEDRPGVDLCAAPELRFEGGKGAGAASSR